jgi:hypothetical protein
MMEEQFKIIKIDKNSNDKKTINKLITTLIGIKNLFKRKKNININKKERNPGIELLRLLAMYAIIVHHVLLC